MTVCICWTAEETNQKSLERLAQRAGKEAVQWGRNHIEPFFKTLKKKFMHVNTSFELSGQDKTMPEPSGSW
jgi:arginine deiminase